MGAVIHLRQLAQAAEKMGMEVGAVIHPRRLCKTVWRAARQALTFSNTEVDSPPSDAARCNWAVQVCKACTHA